MGNIVDHFNTIDFYKSLETVQSLMNKATGEITFWGDRMVSVDGFERSIPLERLAIKILGTSGKCTKESSLFAWERLAGLKIVILLEALYTSTDKLAANRNWFTRALHWIKEFSFIPYTPRFYFELDAKRDFQSYSQESFTATFGGTLPPNPFSFEMSGKTLKHPDCESLCSNFNGNRLVAKEDSIQRLCNNSV